jgi:hypothetical protein
MVLQTDGRGYLLSAPRYRRYSGCLNLCATAGHLPDGRQFKPNIRLLQDRKTLSKTFCAFSDAVSGTIAVGQSVQLLQKISVGQGIPPIGNPFQALQSSQASQQLEKFAQVSSGVVLRITQQKAITSEEKFLLWIEK